MSYLDFAFWNPQTHAWQVEAGKFEVLVGSSSADLPLKTTVQLEASTTDQLPDSREVAPQYYQLPKNPAEFSLDQFEMLPGSVKVNNPVRTTGNFDLNSTLWEARDTWQGRLVNKYAMKAAENLIENTSENSGNARRTVEASATNAPLRSFVMGGIPLSVSIGMCHILNARYLKAGWHLLKGKLTKK
ncbi:MAG: hypothetical protein GX768_11645 [Chloroflexi bacterium]|nr:hypothetical protein [Chloroflexota bacterium]